MIHLTLNGKPYCKQPTLGDTIHRYDPANLTDVKRLRNNRYAEKVCVKCKNVIRNSR